MSNKNYPTLPSQSINSRKPSVHNKKLSLDLSLITAPNKNISDVSFPSIRNPRYLSTSRSKSKFTSFPSTTTNNQTLAKSFKKYCINPIERQKSVFPISGVEAIRSMNDALSEFELRELTNYNEVYFIGDYKHKMHGSLRELNWGYDDDEANYKIIIGDHLGFRFEILCVLGKGSFGQVCKCFDHKTSELVAIKILKNKNKFHKQGEVEIKLLKALNDANQNGNIVKILGNFVFRCHICIVFELLSISLFEHLKRNHYRGLPSSTLKQIAINILSGLKQSKEKQIIHCDLKPENILFTSPNSQKLKIIDFGSGCFEGRQIYTYIQSRFYRSPEVMLGLSYTTAIDMWSLGCILVELYRGFPLFPGKNEEDQMSKIIEVLGVPPRNFIEHAPRKLNFFDRFCIPMPFFDSKNQLRIAGSRPLKRLIDDNDEFLEFVSFCISWQPEKRLDPETALRHKWIAT